jgi:hypothetical protein
MASTQRTTLADAIKGEDAAPSKRWRFEDEVPARDTEFVKIKADSTEAKNIAKYFGLSKIDGPLPSGHQLIGFRPFASRRPLVVTDPEGEKKLVTESGFKKYLRKR